MKHPVAVAFAVAVVACLVLTGIVLTIYTLQQAPWALAMIVVAFPFLWFFAWLITNGISWWRDTTGSNRSAEAGGQPSDQK
jgi:hypothetical protein